MSLDVGTLMASLGLDSKPFEEGVDSAVAHGAEGLGAFGRIAETAGVSGAGRFSNGLSGLVNDMGSIGLSGGELLAGGVGVAAVGLGAVALQIGSEFHAAFATIENDTGATGSKLDALKEQFKDLYADLPNSTQEVAGTLAEVQSRLDGTAEQSGNLARSILELTNGMGGDLQQNTSAVLDLFTRWQTPTSQQAGLLDQLAAAAQHSGVPVGQLIQQAADGAPDFQMLGYSVQQAVATIASMGKEGADATQFLTGLQHGIVNLGTLQQSMAQQSAEAAKQQVQSAQQQAQQVQAIQNAWQNVQQAQDSEADSQRDLMRLLNGGAEQAATDGRLQLRDATTSVTVAQGNLITSKKALDDLLAGPSEDDEAKARLKLAQATAAVQAALTSEASAQNALTDAQQNGVSGTDLAKLQDAYTSSTLAVTQSQFDQADAQKALADLQAGSPAQQAAIAAAQLGVQQSTNQLNDAQQAKVDLQTQQQQQLGPALDGSALISAAQKKVQTAHQGVTSALEGVRTAQQKQTTQTQVQSLAVDANGGSFSTTRKILADMGDTNASSSQQLSDLTNWLFTTSDSTDQLGVASELFGKRSALQFVTAINSGKLSLQDITGAMNDSGGAVGRAAANNDTATEKMSKAWHHLETDISPIATHLFDGLSNTIQNFPAELDRFCARFKSGLGQLGSDIKSIGVHIFDGLVDGMVAILNKIIDAFNFMTGELSFSVPSWVPVLGGDKFAVPKVPHVPKLHSGGQVPGIPGSEMPAILQAGETVRTSSQEAALQGALAVTGAGGGPSVTIANHFHGPVADERWVAAQVTKASKNGVDMVVRPSAVRRR